MNLYDPRCLEYSTAVKAVYKLWKDGKWSLLAKLDLTQAMINTPFDAFDSHITTKYLRSDMDVQRFMQSLAPSVRDAVHEAAICMLCAYSLIYSERYLERAA